jgi:hypothetical protein
VVTHPTTNLPISSLCMAERTGCPVFSSLWPYVLDMLSVVAMVDDAVGRSGRGERIEKGEERYYKIQC